MSSELNCEVSFCCNQLTKIEPFILVFVHLDYTQNISYIWRHVVCRRCEIIAVVFITATVVGRAALLDGEYDVGIPADSILNLS
jgi:hypothetical protein